MIVSVFVLYPRTHHQLKEGEAKPCEMHVGHHQIMHTPTNIVDKIQAT